MARKKSKLPFVVQPRLKPVVELIGNDITGQIEILRKGYLTVAEKAIVQGAVTNEDAMAELVVLAGGIATTRSLLEKR